MNPTQCMTWIEGHYGKPFITHANGVFVMAVAVYQGIAVGCGSCASNAAWDLFCDLVPMDRSTKPVNFSFQPWETERRERLDRKRGAA